MLSENMLKEFISFIDKERQEHEEEDGLNDPKENVVLEITAKSWFIQKPKLRNNFIDTTSWDLIESKQNKEQHQSILLGKFMNHRMKLTMMKDQVYDSLLQVSTYDKVMLYSIHYQYPTELFLVVGLQDLMNMSTYVDLAF